jgi:mono/diheme cytochrome c family protein
MPRSGGNRRREAPVVRCTVSSLGFAEKGGSRPPPAAALPAAVVALFVLAASADAQQPAAKAPTAAARQYDEQVRPLLLKHCVECHGPSKPKGDLRLDTLSTDFADEAVRKRWQSAAERVKAGVMPPKTRPRPPAVEIKALTDWIHGRVEAAETARRAGQGRVVLRRLNRVEYENTVRDLLGINTELRDLLPQDSSADGFDNVGEAMHVSSFLMERYLEAADIALNAAIVNTPRPTAVKKKYTFQDDRRIKAATEKVFRPQDDALISFTSSPWQALTLWQFYPQERGHYRFRISAYGFQSAGKPVVYRVDAGPMLMATRNHLVDYFDAPADKPTVVEFVDYLEARSTIRILPYGLASAQAVHKVGAAGFQGPGLALQWVEVEGPLNDTWPPAGHRRLFGDLPQGPAPAPNNRNRVEVVSRAPEVDAERILRGFARRAFRRAVADDDLKPYLELVKAALTEKRSFEQAVRVGLKAILVSPQFLFLREKPGALDDFALASRLSYFLWSTMPDEELLAAAEAGRLPQPAVLRAQVERLLADPKAAAFTENFVGQWLGLRDIDFTEPSHILYPDYDEMLKVAMVRETELFFKEVLAGDLSLTNFVASDFSMLNGRLAKHYGIPGVDGWAFRKVTLPPGSHRGGVLTMAGVLKVTANGTNTSPIIRGAWVLERILGTPPPRPPADVPALEPDIRGATTVREQLAKHRSTPACASCHVKIDPPGFALESFDVIGGYREFYRTTGRGKPVMLDGRRMPYLQGPKVDPSYEMEDGRKFADIDEFKQLLLTDKDQLARALAEKLTVYATGGAIRTADRGEIEAIVAKVRQRNYGFRTLIHEIVQSRLFREK